MNSKKVMEKSILTKKEKKYLNNVLKYLIKPLNVWATFTKEQDKLIVDFITVFGYKDGVVSSVKTEQIILPLLESKELTYKGMELNKTYIPFELGLSE